FIDFPENISEMEVEELPLPVIQSKLTLADSELIAQAADIIQAAKKPLILVGNGAVRAKASESLYAFSTHYNIPIINTFMAKGVVPHYKNPLSMGTTGLQKGDYNNGGFAEADLVICVGFDMVEYHPHLWNPNRKHKIIHIDTRSAEVDYSYIPHVELVGNIAFNLDALRQALPEQPKTPIQFPLRQSLFDEMERVSQSQDWPMKPQKIIWDLRTAMGKKDIAISDVGAHKMWMARMFRCELPNTCIISNGFASMGIAVPGAVGAKLAFPDRAVVAVTGDAGFMMSSQEIETA
ncbi:acetolactate synthase large subunit, partial [Thioclava sp. JE_KL1]|nr:acetolactate synthase large subunit [Thioclava sp. JE_KL1]